MRHSKIQPIYVESIGTHNHKMNDKNYVDIE